MAAALGDRRTFPLKKQNPAVVEGGLKVLALGGAVVLILIGGPGIRIPIEARKFPFPWIFCIILVHERRKLERSKERRERKKKEKSKLHVEIARANWTRLEAYMERYNSSEERLTAKIKPSDIINAALARFLDLQH